MAGSLLHAVGLPELVTHTLADYEARAVALATDRPRMAELRARLAANRDASPLFDTPRFVRDYEDVLESVVKRPAGVALVDEPATRPLAVPPPAQLAMQQESLLSMMRAGMHSIVEVGGATLAQAWRAREPKSHYTAVGAQDGSGPWCTGVVARDPEQLDPAEWRQLAPGQCWVFPETLERLRDPWTFLRTLRAQALGRVELVACVNNGQYWLLQALLATGNLNYQTPGMPDRRNLHLFTRTSLAALLQECGFAVAEMVSVQAQQPPSPVLDAIGQLAAATGGDPVLAQDDARAFQYLVRAIAA
jgi:hypothetical protein